MGRKKLNLVNVYLKGHAFLFDCFAVHNSGFLLHIITSLTADNRIGERKGFFSSHIPEDTDAVRPAPCEREQASQ